MLVIDELHNVLGGRNSGVRREFLNLLRFLGNSLRIPLVGVGIRDAYLAIRSDDQLENRFAPLALPRWEPGAEACTLLASFAAAFPLRRPSPIATEEMATYLLTRCEGTIGEHPAPVAATPAAGRVGSLSSWLSRLATTYAVPVRELLGPNLGVLAAIPDLLDQQPLPELFDALSQRTGVPVGRLAMMTLPGWVPCLFDSYLMAARDAEDTFDTMCSSIRCCWLPGSPLVSCWPAAVAGAARGFRPLA